MSDRPTFETLLYTHEAKVATITLHRPEAANAFNETMFQELYTAALHALTQADTRVILLNSVGKIFCAGGDLSEFARTEEIKPHILRLTTLFHSTIARLARAEAPVIAAVQGSAGGAGMALVLGADLVLASENARFTMAYTAAGLSPDGSSTFYLPRLVGSAARARADLNEPPPQRPGSAGLGHRQPRPTRGNATRGSAGPGAAAGRRPITRLRRRQAPAAAILRSIPRNPIGRRGAGHRRYQRHCRCPRRHPRLFGKTPPAIPRRIGA